MIILVKLFGVDLGYHITAYRNLLNLLFIIFVPPLDAARWFSDKPPSEMREVTLALSLMGSR